MRPRTKEPTTPFAIALVRARARLGLTQAEMGRKLGIPARTWQDYEREKRRPPASTQALILKALAGISAPSPFSEFSHPPS